MRHWIEYQRMRHRAVHATLGLAALGGSWLAALALRADDDEARHRPPAHIRAEAPHQLLVQGHRLAPVGVTVDTGGRVFYTDARRGTLAEVLGPGQLRTVTEGLDRPRGLAWRDGRLLLVAEGWKPGPRSRRVHGPLLAVDPAGKGVAVLASGLRRPIELAPVGDRIVVSSSGLRRSGRGRDEDDEDDNDEDWDREPPAGSVLRWSPGSGFEVLARSFRRPAGVLVAPDAGVLVVAESHGSRRSRRAGPLFLVPASGPVQVHRQEAVREAHGLARDGLGRLFLGAQRSPRRGLDDDDDDDDDDERGAGRARGGRGVLLRLPDGQPAAEFASGLRSPAGLAFAPRGDLLVADPAAGVVVRFVAPAPPVLDVDGPLATRADPLALSGRSEAGAQIVVVGGAAPAEAVARADGRFQVAVPLRLNQENRLLVYAVGRGGSGLASAPAAAVAVHDDTPPLIAATVSPPPNAAGWHRTDVTVSFTCSDTGSGVALCPPSELVTLEGAGRVVEATALDRAGNAATVSVTLNIDKTPPEIAIETPAEGLYTRATSADVAGRVDDAHELTVTVNDVAALVSGLAYRAAVPLPQEGETRLTAVAVDVAGNRAEASRTVHVDRTPPALALLSPTDGAFVRGPAVDVAGTVSDASPVTVDVNGEPAPTTGTHFSTTLAGADGAFAIVASAVDAAGNAASARVVVTLDSTPPDVSWTSPADGLVTRDATVTVSGSVADLTPVTLLLDGAPLTLASGAFSRVVPLPAEGLRTLVLTATDGVGLTSRVERGVTVDRTPPELEVLSPAPDAVLATVPVVLRGRVQDATDVTVTVDGQAATLVGDFWEARREGLPEGPHTLIAAAQDAAGNGTTRSVPVMLDLTPPAVSIDVPPPSFLTRDASVTVTGTVQDFSPRSVAANGVAGSFGTGGTGPHHHFSVSGVGLADGDNFVEVVATDALGRQGRAGVTVTRDSIPPVVSLTAPSHVTRLQAGRAVGLAQDNLALAEVVVVFDGSEVGRFASSPFEVALAVPDGRSAGDVLTLVVEATDTAGNRTRVSREVGVAPDGVIMGQVLADETGHPVEGARVATVGREDRTTLTDARGRYSLQAVDPDVLLAVAARDGSTLTVERRVSVASGVGTVPVDARLTRLAPAVSVGPEGGTLTAGSLRLTLAPGRLAADAPFRLTDLSPQGLPALLPLGWSPVAAVDVQGPVSAGVPADLVAEGLPPTAVHLAHYHATVHSWILEQADLVPFDGRVAAEVTAPGSYALVVPDDGPAGPVVPAAGEPLPEVPAETVPFDAVAEGEVVPQVLPPTGGDAQAVLAIQASTPLPSGTTLRTEVTESFTLASGATGADETRDQDVVFYRAPISVPDAVLTARIPVVPLRTFDPTELAEARVNVRVLSGREAVRGRTGGSLPVTLTSGTAAVALPEGSLAEDTAVVLESVAVSGFVPSLPSFEPFAEVVVGLAGRRLNMPAELSEDFSGTLPGDTFWIARVERVAGVPYLAVVAAAELRHDRVVSRAHPDLPGVREGGRYVFYRAGTPVGLVRGTSRAGGTPVRALVRPSGSPFTALSDPEGRYATVALAGPTTLSAGVPATSLAGAATVTLLEGVSVVADIELAGAVATAAVTPPNGSVSVAVSSQVEIAASAPLQAATVTAETVQLRKGGPLGEALPVRLLLSGSGRSLAVVPHARLEPATTYTLTASGLADVFGGLVAVPTTSFTTQAETLPAYDTARIVFTLPGADGLIRILGPPDTLPPGSTVLVLNSGNGVAVSFSIGDDGSVNGELPGSIDDRLLVTISDPLGNVVHLERSQFEAQDGSGRTAVGPGGGVVRGPGGAELRVPEGALDKGAVFKVEPFGPEAFLERPELPDSHFGGGLRVTAPPDLKLKTPGDLVFPKPPDAPDGAFYYVYRRLTGPEGRVAFQVIDHAFVEGEGDDAKVVTASYPFIGWEDSVDSWEVAALGQSVGLGVGAQVMFALMWQVDALRPGLPTQGLITGSVRRPVFRPGQADPVFEPVPGIPVSGTRNGHTALLDPAGGGTVALSRADGTYALLDPHYVGGPVQVTAVGPEGPITLTAFEADPDTRRDRKLPIQYRNIAVASFALPAVAPRAPLATFETRVLKLAEDGRRRDVKGIVTVGTPLIIGFRHVGSGSFPTIQAAKVLNEPFAVRADATDDPLKLDFVLDGLYTPSRPGRYTLSAIAIPPLGGSPITVEHTFLAVAAAGGNTEPLIGEPPDVITSLVEPRDGATGVAVDVFVQVVFTEPVSNLLGQVQLLDEGDGDVRDVPVRLSGTGFDAMGRPVVVEDLSQADPRIGIVSLTVRPVSTLRYASRHRLVLGPGIVDLDRAPTGEPDPRLLRDAPRSFAFVTYSPELLGSTDFFRGREVVAFPDRAYVASEPPGPHGWISVFDIADPTRPSEIESARVGLTGRAMSIAGDEPSAIVGGRLVVAGAGPNPVTKGPSNLFLFEARGDRLIRVGVVSLTQAMEEGTILRVRVKGQYAYVITFRTALGATLDVVDLDTARRAHERGLRTGRKIAQEIVTPGVGFGQEAIVATIPVREPGSSRQAHLLALAVGDFLYNGASQPLVVTAGTVPAFAVVDPLAVRVVLASPRIDAPEGALTAGYAVDLGTFGGARQAVVVGIGVGPHPTTRQATTGPVLMVLNLTDPERPVVAGVLLLPGVPRHVTLRGDLALVGTDTTIVLVDLSDATRPKIVGEIPGIGGRLALVSESLVYGTSQDPATGGLRSAGLAHFAAIRRVTPSTITYDPQQGPLTENPITIDARVLPGDYSIGSAKVEILQNGSLIHTLPALVSGSSAVATWPARQVVDLQAAYTARAVVDPEGDRPLVTPARDVSLLRIAYVDKRGQEVVAPAVSDPRPVVTLDPVGPGHVTLLGDGTRAQVHISGEVTDAIADIVPNRAGDITSVTVEGQRLPVTRVPEPPSPARPHAFRGRFSGTVSLDIGDGPNSVVVDALNALGNRGYDMFTIDVDQEVSITVPETEGAAMASVSVESMAQEVLATSTASLVQTAATESDDLGRFLDSYTLAAAPMDPATTDTVILLPGAVDIGGDEPALVETTPDSLTFVGRTAPLGDATLQLDAPLTGNDPLLRDVLTARLSSTRLGLWDQPMALVESEPTSGVFRMPARRLPNSVPLALSFARMPDADLIDSVEVTLGLDLNRVPHVLVETAPTSNVFAGDVGGLGAVRIAVHAIDQTPGDPSSLQLYLDASELGLNTYFLQLGETAAGSQVFTTHPAALPPIAEPIPQIRVVRTTVVGVQDHPGSSAGAFEPVWVVAQGVAAFDVNDRGRIGFDPVELTTEPAAALTTASATSSASGVRFKLPVAFVRDTGNLRVPNVRPAVEEAPPGRPHDARPLDHTVAFDVRGQALPSPAQTAPKALSKDHAIRGTQSALTIRGRWRKDRIPVRVRLDDSAGVEFTITRTGVDGDCPASANECPFFVETSVVVAEDARPGTRMWLVVEFADGGPEEGLLEFFYIARQRLIVFAVDGLGWAPFELLRNDPDAFGPLFGDPPQTSGRQAHREAWATFAPITYGRWTTVFSGALASEHRVPSNHFLNRQTLTDPGGDHGDLDQCLSCRGGTLSQARQGLYVMDGGGAFNRHFQVDFVYDRLQQQKAGRSMVILQVTGLGRATRGATRWPWQTPMRNRNGVWYNLSYSLAFSTGDGELDAAVAKNAGKRIDSGDVDDIDLMVVYLPGLDKYLHSRSTNVVADTETYVRRFLAPAINTILDKSAGRFHGTATYAMFSDHGHIAVGEDRFMDLHNRGAALSRLGLPRWSRVLQPNERYRADWQLTRTRPIGNPDLPMTDYKNVIFIPHGGIAHVYVAANATECCRLAVLPVLPKWDAPPSLETLQPLVNAIVRGYAKDDRGNRIVDGDGNPILTDVLVRVPENGASTFGDSQYKVVPLDDYDSNRPLGEQLRDLSTLAERPWDYADPKDRVQGWISENTGDIVLLANMVLLADPANPKPGYQFDPKPLRATHGSLLEADARIPLAFSYPDATGTVDEYPALKRVLDYIRGLPQPIKDPTEATAMEIFFGLTR